MQDNLKKVSALCMFVVAMAFFMTGCVEHRYYRTHHQHSPEYYHRHHMPPPAGVDIDIHH
jgi:hypothetical protein